MPEIDPSGKTELQVDAPKLNAGKLDSGFWIIYTPQGDLTTEGYAHAVKVAGIDHVGIASDFDGGGGIVGWKDASETANVTIELVERGYSEAEIAKIWGENLLRVMEAAEQGAK